MFEEVHFYQHTAQIIHRGPPSALCARLNATLAWQCIAASGVPDIPFEPGRARVSPSVHDNSRRLLRHSGDCRVYRRFRWRRRRSSPSARSPFIFATGLCLRHVKLDFVPRESSVSKGRKCRDPSSFGQAVFINEGPLPSSNRGKEHVLTPSFFIASCYSCSLKQAGPWSTLFPKPKRRPESHEHLNYPSSPPSSPSNLSGSIDFLQQQQRRVRVEAKECDCGRLIFLSPLSKQGAAQRRFLPRLGFIASARWSRANCYVN